VRIKTKIKNECRCNEYANAPTGNGGRGRNRFIMNSANKQGVFFPEMGVGSVAKGKLKARSSTFIDNMKLPIHRWFRYSAGFSAEWVASEITECKKRGGAGVLDPFAGSGTTLLASESNGVTATGFESHPFIYRVARTKLNWNVDHKEFRDRCQEVLSCAKNSVRATDRVSVPLLGKCFDPDALAKLDSLKNVYADKYDDGGELNELIWLAITGIIRACSTAGTAQWQYVLPKNKKAKVLDPFVAFTIKTEQIIEDIFYAKNNFWTPSSRIVMTDARDPGIGVKDKFDLVITSPPYPNNYDYADATRLEMTFWGEVACWGDLHGAVRQYLVRSCSQHSEKEKLNLDDLLDDDVLNPIKSGLTKACRELEVVRLSRGGRKTYHTMVAAYFIDLGNALRALRPLCKRGSRLCFVIGDSAPYGVYLSVDKWLGELAVAAGFQSYSFEKIRDRNTKWKNRKHTIPLQEGRLWVDG